MLDTAHPTGSGATFSNRPTVYSNLSELALEQACIDIWALVGADGLRISINPKALLLPPQLAFDAERILHSEKQNDTAINALKNKGMIPSSYVWRFLTSASAWFVLTDNPGLVLYNKRAAELKMFNDDSTYDTLYGMTERYVFDYFDPRAVYGSIGA